MKRLLKNILIGMLVVVPLAIGANFIDLASQVQGVLPVSNGGTGSTTYNAYNPAAVTITGGTINGLSAPLPIASGGTGSATNIIGPLSTGSANDSTARATANAVSTLVNQFASQTAPTIASGFASGPAITASNAKSFRVVLGAANSTNTGTLSMPAAPNGWTCSVQHVGRQDEYVNVTGYTTTSVTFANTNASNGAYNWVTNEQLLFQCSKF